MRRFLLLFLAVMTLSPLWADVEFNEKNFPDQKLRDQISWMDRDGDGVFSDDELNATTSINLYSGIDDATGLEYFTNIDNLRISDSNELTDLNTSYFPKLRTISLSGCSIASLDLSTNEKLEEIQLYDMEALSSVQLPNSVTSISLSKMPRLTTLDVSACADLENISVSVLGITSLDLSNKTKLTYVSIDEYGSEWEHSPITSVNLKGCESLNDIKICEDPVESLDVSGLENLTNLTCQRTQLSSLNVEGCIKLRQLSVFSNKLKELNLAGLTSLYTLECFDNQLAKLDFTGLTELYNVFCQNNKLMSLDGSGIAPGWKDDQKPDVVAVKLAADQVGIDVSDNPIVISQVKNLNGMSSGLTAEEVTVDGVRYFVFYNDASTAEELLGEGLSWYDYDTGYTGDAGVDLMRNISLNVTEVTKHQAFIKLSSTDVVKGVYGGTAPTSPDIIRSQDYDGKLTYTSSNEKVVTVDKDGKLTIVGAGKATITVSGAETDYRLAPKAISYDVEIDKAKVTFKYAEAEQEMIILDEVPENKLTIGVYDGTVAYKTSDSKIATIDKDGRLVIVAAGMVTVTASGAETANCYEATPATYQLTVIKRTSALTLSSTEVNGVYGGKAGAPAVTKENDYDGTLAYASSDEKVVKVSTKGALTIVGAGEATITVSGSETAYYYAPASVTYKVKVAKAEVTFSFAEESQTAFFIDEMPENKLSTDIYDGTVVYTSSDSEIVEVDADGNLIAKNEGVVTITATGAETSNCKAASASYELTIKLFIVGDANGDNEVNVADLEAIVNYIMGKTEGLDKRRADVNGDGKINVVDLTAVVNLIEQLNSQDQQ